MDLNLITKQHILRAVEKIEKEKIELEPSTKYDVIINDKPFPPKEVMRYANLLANGTKEWFLNGGEPTNRFFKKFQFDVVPKGGYAGPTPKKEAFVQLLKKIGFKDASAFFGIAEDLMRELNIVEGDNRVTYGTSSYKRMSITIGHRYMLVYATNERHPWHFISTIEQPSSTDIIVSNFDGAPTAYYYKTINSEIVINHLPDIAKAAQKELDRTTSSSDRNSSNPILEEAIFDSTFRTQLFEEAFGNVVSLTGQIWKLGCNWAGSPISLYNFIKKNEIVISIHGKLYAPGDLVIITQGQKVYAIAKVLEILQPITNNPDFESEAKAVAVSFQSEVIFAKAEWYELENDQIFTYQLQQGICRVNIPEVRNKVITIWNDRFINYWVFQCNPADFDFEKAIRNNLLHDWTVVAHKDKIKQGDKVILWLTGKKPGCYAIARIVSDPAEKAASPDDHLWKTEPKTSLKAGIEILHSLIDRPLLWQNIKGSPGLEDLKVGNQGTNFSATRKQFNTLLSLIDKSTPNMGSEIDLFLNTILYGPPGTGKTFKLNEYKEQYFTDRGITKSSRELLKDKVSAYPFWKVLAAVLASFDSSVSVTELLENPLVKAKINPDAKTPRNTIWRILQSYADEASTEMDAKYKGVIQLFQKNAESQWSLLPNKKQDLVDIIDQELLDLAVNPVLQIVASAASIDRFKFITFHQKYGYEDFIEGIKPVLKKEAGEDAEDLVNDLQFELKKGIFYNSCLEALKLAGYASFKECHDDTVENRVAKFEAIKSNTTKQFALFIDEINRANISAVFGELITLLEDDKRIGAANEMWVQLPYSNEQFCVPANLYVIGTMNTADRSIALLDIALRRRFEFKALYPDYKLGEWWAPLLEPLNQAIYNWKKNPDFFIGHAFFINRLEAERAKILNTKIIPLLYEYCQNNAESVKKILADAGIQIKPTGIKENFQIIAE